MRLRIRSANDGTGRVFFEDEKGVDVGLKVTSFELLGTALEPLRARLTLIPDELDVTADVETAPALPPAAAPPPTLAEKAIARARLGKADVIVVRCDVRLANKQRAQLEHEVGRKFPGHRVLVLDDGMALELAGESEVVPRGVNLGPDGQAALDNLGRITKANLAEARAGVQALEAQADRLARVADDGPPRVRLAGCGFVFRRAPEPDRPIGSDDLQELRGPRRIEACELDEAGQPIGEWFPVEELQRVPNVGCLANGVGRGEVAYEAYRAAAGGKSIVTGDPLPPFHGLVPKVRIAWEASADAVLGAGPRDIRRAVVEARSLFGADRTVRHYPANAASAGAVRGEVPNAGDAFVPPPAGAVVGVDLASGADRQGAEPTQLKGDGWALELVKGPAAAAGSEASGEDVPKEGESMWVCPDCGPRVAADEDGCCASCGVQCAVAPYEAPAGGAPAEDLPPSPPES